MHSCKFIFTWENLFQKDWVDFCPRKLTLNFKNVHILTTLNYLRSYLTRHQRILWGRSLGCKNLMNFTCLSIKFHIPDQTRGIPILGEVRNVAVSRPTQQLLWYKFHDFLDVFALAHSKINQIAQFLDENVRNQLKVLEGKWINKW